MLDRPSRPLLRRQLVAACTLALVAAAAGLLAWRLSACGPFALAPRFGEIGRPDVRLDRFLQGDLGIVRPGWPLTERIVAYRCLSGLELDPAARASVLPRAGAGGADASSGIQVWRQARARVTGAGEAPPLEVETSLSDYSSYTRVLEDALGRSATTLDERIRAHGAGDPGVQAWVKAQDQVFASARGAAAIPPTVQGPPWLKADRDYQIASALFYAERFDEARKGFAAIAADKASPWRAWAAYMQARARVREASLTQESAQAPAAQEHYRKAQAQLEAILKDPSLASVHEASRRYLDLVRHRTEPEQVLAEACSDLLRPAPGAGFAAMVERYRTAAEASGGAFGEGTRHAEDLHAWLEAMAPDRSKEAGDQAVSRWKSGRSLPWLVAALSLTPLNHADRSALREAASLDSATRSPRLTLWWNRLEMELLALEPKARGVALEAALRQKDLPAWAENRIRAQRRQLAGNVLEWATWAPSRLGAVEVLSVSPPEPPTADDPVVVRHGARPMLLDEPEAAVVERCLTLETLVAIVKAGSLGPKLTEDLAHVAWTRAVLLERWPEAEALRGHLDPALQKRLPAGWASVEAAERRFQVACVLMEFPGLRPAFTPGLGRGNGQMPALGEVDALRDNWWCHGDSTPTQAPCPVFITREQLATARAEHERLERIPDAWLLFGESVLARAEAHPEDPAVPQALHRFVRLTRIPACPGPEVSNLSRRAFRILHQKFPSSEWTRKTPYHF